MTDDREPFREARAAGLKARHEQRLENATYTAAEMKVLTEAALRLGRKEALEEAVAAVTNKLGITSRALPIIRSLFSQAAPDATSGRTDPGMDSDLPQDSQAVRSPQGGEAVDLVGRLREAVEAARVRRLAERKGDPA